ncbi:MAG: sugar ABC transporter permease, partial [Planctomycetota bacterium]
MRTGRTRYLFLVPAFLLLGIVIFYPIIRCVWLSFTLESGAGVSNYSRAFSDPRFGASLWNTCVFT